ncbi:MAG: galactokinase family protein, partial [Bacteroidota bacterium]
MNKKTFSVSAPGRVCLFGEHQDYLGLPVIPSAISLRVEISGSHRTDLTVRIDLPDIGSMEEFSLSGTLLYVKERDYFRSAVNVIRRHGFTFSRGLDCVVRGKIPINTGTSSSSALVVAWVNLLARMSDQSSVLEPKIIAQYAYESEVLEFGEPGGMMDQYSTALGKIIFLEFTPATKVTPLAPPFGTFVLGDSGEPKDTMSILSRVKDQVIMIAKKLSAEHKEFSLITAVPEDVQRYEKELSKEQSALLRGTIQNHQITLKARTLLQTSPLDH